MTDSDITRLERELGITLPAAYKKAVVPFCIPALAGNTTHALWDDAPRLVELNLKLQAGTQLRPAWPPHMFAVGNPYGDELVAIDTRTADGPVWWLDHGMVDSKASHQSHARFADWVAEYRRDMRSDLADEGIDPDGSPKAEPKATGKRAMQNLGTWIGIALLGLGILILLFWVKKRLMGH